jgi:flagella basal body P-ring formation protein FlgA
LIYKDLMPRPERLWTSSFPLPGGLRQAGGKTFSACLRRLLSASAVLLLSSNAVASAQQQMQQAVARYMHQQLQAEAQRQGWHGLRHSLELGKVSTQQTLPPCHQALRVQGPGNAAVLARQRLQVTCNDSPSWTLSVQVQANVSLPMVQATSLIERGAVLQANQLKLSDVPLEKNQRGFYQDIHQVLGQAAKRRIRAGQTLSPALLSAAAVVRRGQQVSIRASHDGIQASTQGQALADGRVGEVIRVRNLASEKVIEAKVLEPGVVSSTFN